jgi:hypothetical protein
MTRPQFKERRAGKPSGVSLKGGEIFDLLWCGIWGFGIRVGGDRNRIFISRSLLGWATMLDQRASEFSPNSKAS